MSTIHFTFDALSARTIRGLRIAMLKNNAKRGTSFHYTDFQKVEGKWHCWFRAELNDSDPLMQTPQGKVEEVEKV